jgi:hypothetical protein
LGVAVGLGVWVHCGRLGAGSVALSPEYLRGKEPCKQGVGLSPKDVVLPEIVCSWFVAPAEVSERWREPAQDRVKGVRYHKRGSPRPPECFHSLFCRLGRSLAASAAGSQASSSLREVAEPNMSIHVRSALGPQQGFSQGFWDLFTSIERVFASLVV